MKVVISILLFLVSFGKGERMWFSSRDSPNTMEVMIPDDINPLDGMALMTDISDPPGVDDAPPPGKLELSVFVGFGEVRKAKIEVQEKTVDNKLPLCFESMPMDAFNTKHINVTSTTDIIDDKIINFSLVPFDCSKIKAESFNKKESGSNIGRNIVIVIAVITGICLLCMVLYWTKRQNNKVFYDDVPLEDVKLDKNRSTKDSNLEVTASKKVKTLFAEEFAKFEISKKDLVTAETVLSTQMSELEEKRTSIKKKTNIHPSTLNEFGEQFIEELELRTDEQKQIVQNKLDRALILDTGKVTVEEVVFQEDKFTSVYGFLATTKEEDGTITVAYAFHSIKFKINTELSLTQPQIDAIEANFGKHKALLWFQEQKIIPGINYVE